MATNFIQPGNTITVVAPSAVKSGDLVVIDTLAGVAVTDAASGSPVEIMTTGVFELKKTSAQAWAVGNAIYATAAGVATTDAGTTPANTLIGAAIAPAANPSATGRVRLSV